MFYWSPPQFTNERPELAPLQSNRTLLTQKDPQKAFKFLAILLHRNCNHFLQRMLNSFSKLPFQISFQCHPFLGKVKTKITVTLLLQTFTCSADNSCLSFPQGLDYNEVSLNLETGLKQNKAWFPQALNILSPLCMLKDLDCGQYSLLRSFYRAIPKKISQRYSPSRICKGLEHIFNVHIHIQILIKDCRSRQETKLIPAIGAGRISFDLSIWRVNKMRGTVKILCGFHKDTTNWFNLIITKSLILFAKNSIVLHNFWQISGVDICRQCAESWSQIAVLIRDLSDYSMFIPSPCFGSEQKSHIPRGSFVSQTSWTHMKTTGRRNAEEHRKLSLCALCVKGKGRQDHRNVQLSQSFSADEVC